MRAEVPEARNSAPGILSGGRVGSALFVMLFSLPAEEGRCVDWRRERAGFAYAHSGRSMWDVARLAVTAE